MKALLTIPLAIMLMAVSANAQNGPWSEVQVTVKIAPGVQETYVHYDVTDTWLINDWFTLEVNIGGEVYFDVYWWPDVTHIRYIT